jgi:hypothetical protein
VRFLFGKPQNAFHYDFEIPVIFAEIRVWSRGFKLTKKRKKKKKTKTNQTTKHKITKKNKQN